MITEQQCVAIVIACLFIGIFVGMVIWYLFGTPKCDHQWEKIIDSRTVGFNGDESDIKIVHMCKKCGKRKFTRV